MSLSAVGYRGAIGALDGGGSVVGSGARLGGGSGRLDCGRTVEFVALRVALRRRAGVDAVRVALGGGLQRPPAFPGGFDQVLQGDRSGLCGITQAHTI